jgi:hypothetical protein
MGKSNFSTINNRLTVSTEGFDRGLDKAKEKLKGFGEKSSGWLDDAKDLFNSSDGLGAVGKLAGMATGFAGPIGLAATAVGTLVTGLKSAMDIWGAQNGSEKLDVSKISNYEGVAQARKNIADKDHKNFIKNLDERKKKEQELDGKIAQFRWADGVAKQKNAVQAVRSFTNAMNDQSEAFGKSSEEAALFSLKMGMVRNGLGSVAYFDGRPLGNKWKERERQLDPNYIAYRDAKAAASYRADLSLAQGFKDQVANPYDTISKRLSDAQRLKRAGLLSGSDLGRTGMSILEQAERLAPSPGSQLASSVDANSQAAASFVLKSQAAGIDSMKPPMQRLTEALERLRIIEQKRSDEAGKFGDEIGNAAPFKVNIAQF